MKIVLFGAIGLFAAPLIAPMFAAAGLFGAAAVSSGLATLGGGALSAGGFGMIGGTIVVGTVSSGLGLLLSNDNCGINAIVYDKYIICSTENSCSLIFEGRISIGDSIRLMDGKFYDGNNIYKIKYNDGKVVEYNSENLPLSEWIQKIPNFSLNFF